MSRPIIEVREFSYIYPNSTEFALKNVSFTIEKGDFVGIIGSNKAGKSTLCKALVGVIPNFIGGKWSGDVLVDGEPITGVENHSAADKIGIVFQDAESQFTQETVEDEVAFAMCNHGFSKELMLQRVEEATKACGLFDLLDRSPFRLSGGQQQRLAIACVLALRPEVIILDESTSQLDPIGRSEVFSVVKELHRRGTTIIMVEHNIEKIAEYADKVMVLSHGELVEYGPAKEVFNKREKLAGHKVRVPQVTEAALALRHKLDFTAAPITLPEAKQLCTPLRRPR
ncbi:MAG: ATP-binding cassette domain-containing protein [Limnochordales bacterium]|nr:ABC transporter ATP-binding protein [Bacillota bacterium]